MDDAGNILVRRYAKSNVYIKSTASAPNEETAIGADVLKQPNQCLEIEKVFKVSAKLLENECAKPKPTSSSSSLIDFRHEKIPIEC